MILDWAMQTHTLPGQEQCGDRHAALEFGRCALLAVVDGIGHGSEAAAAAQRAVELLVEHGASESLVSLVRLCHSQLREGRGVAMSLASIDGNARRLCWLGVGNVAGALRRSRAAFSRKHETLLLRAGVVGKQLPELRAATLQLARDDVLVLASDGVRDDFAEGVCPEWSPQRIADDLVGRYGKPTDDALVLVARFIG